MKKLSNTEAELKNSIACKKKHVLLFFCMFSSVNSLNKIKSQQKKHFATIIATTIYHRATHL